MHYPKQQVRGRIALIGDAAHVPARITASGFNASLTDAAALGKAVEQGMSGQTAEQALLQYDEVRLSKVRQMV